MTTLTGHTSEPLSTLPSQRDEPPVVLPDPVPRRVGGRTLDDQVALWGSAVGSVALVWVLWTQVFPARGKVGFVVCAYLAFLGLYGLVTALRHPRPVVVDRLAAAVVTGGAAVVGLALASTLVYTALRGWHALVHINFWADDAAGVGVQAPLTVGGIRHALVGTLIEVAIAVAISLPLGLATAVYMAESHGRFARVVRTVVEAMTALPDILAGLFVYVVLLIQLGFERSGFAAAAALSVTMLPIIARSAEVQLRVVAGGLKEAGLALGASQWSTMWQVVLPTAKSGLATALILGVARGIGETAPVLLTSGASTFTNANPFQEPMNSLPLFIFDSVRSGQTTRIDRGFGAALILLIVVVVLFAITRLLARGPKGSR